MSDEGHGPPAQEDVRLRDHLAGHRTTLANERTLLAYVRTGLTLFVAGVSFIRFFDHLLIESIGWAFVPLGVAVLLLGLARYRKIRDRITEQAEEQGGSGPAG